MKLSISTLTCPDWTLAQIIDACVSAGIGGIDFRGLGEQIDITRMREFTLDLETTLEQIRSQGLLIPCLNTSVTLISPSPQRWQEMLDEAHRYAQLAGKGGVPYLRIFGGAAPKGMSDEEGLSTAQRHLRQIVKICKPHGVLPLVETHDAWSTSAALRQVLHEFDPADAGALWDIEHTSRKGEAPAETVQALGRYLRHVHLKDAVMVEGKSIPKLLGEGDLPIREALAALRGAGYGGWICLETERRWAPEIAPAPEVSLPHFARWMVKG